MLLYRSWSYIKIVLTWKKSGPNLKNWMRFWLSHNHDQPQVRTELNWAWKYHFCKWTLVNDIFGWFNWTILTSYCIQSLSFAACHLSPAAPVTQIMSADHRLALYFIKLHLYFPGGGWVDGNSQINLVRLDTRLGIYKHFKLLYHALPGWVGLTVIKGLVSVQLVLNLPTGTELGNTQVFL